MKNVFIVGGNGFARECYTYIQRMTKVDSSISFKGFLGEGGYIPDLKEFGAFWCGDVADFQFEKNDYVVIGSGDTTIRKRIYEHLKGRLIPFFTVMDPSSVQFHFSELGEANIFTLNCMISSDVKIGNGNLFNGYVAVGHDTKIGNFNFFGPTSQILGEVEIGDLNSIGTSAVLLPHSKIGNNNKIAPLSAVYKGCGDNCCMLGNPARNMNYM